MGETPGTDPTPDGSGGYGCRVLIQNKRGLHARAAAKFVKTASEFDAEIQVTKGGQTVSGRSILGLMMLAAAKGCDVDLNATGPQALDALTTIKAMIDAKFDEEE